MSKTLDGLSLEDRTDGKNFDVARTAPGLFVDGIPISGQSWSYDSKKTASNVTLSNNNLTATIASEESDSVAVSNFSKSKGKWYCEFTYDYSDDYAVVGVVEPGFTEYPAGQSYPGDTDESYGMYADGWIYNTSGSRAYGEYFDDLDTVMMALDMDTGKIYWGTNGIWADSGDPAAGTNPAYTGLSGEKFVAMSGYSEDEAVTVNFGASAFLYEPPVGFKGFHEHTPAIEEVSTFRFEVKTAEADTFQLPIYSGGTYDFTVHWGDSRRSFITAYDDSAANHTYAGAGTYDVTITGTINGWRFNNTGDKTLIYDISNWGPLLLGDSNGYFYGCSNLTVSATDVLDTSGMTDMTNAFYGCTAMTTVPGITDWDMSGVTDMTSMFHSCTNFDQDIGGLDISLVTAMDTMFSGVTLSATNYDALLIGWEAQTEQPNVVFGGGNSLISTPADGLAFNLEQQTTDDDSAESTSLYSSSIGSVGDGVWPGTGQKTLSWTLKYSQSEGVVIFVAFYKNVNVTTPIGDGDAMNDSGSDTVIMNALTAEAGDMMVEASVVYSDYDNDSITYGTELAKLIDVNSMSGKFWEYVCLGNVGANTYVGEGDYVGLAVAIIKKKVGLSVERTGAVLAIDGGSIATDDNVITIPADAEVIIVSVGGYQGGSDFIEFDKLNFTKTTVTAAETAKAALVANGWTIYDAASPYPFSFEVKTAGADTFQLPIYNGGTYDFNVDWGDGSDSDITAYNDAAANHSYSGAGTYDVKITGTINGWRFNNAGDKTLIYDISEWGPLLLGNNNGYFYGCSNLTVSALDILDTSAVTDMENAFRNCTAIQGMPSIGSWDMSSVTTMEYMFAGLYKSYPEDPSQAIQDLSGWDVSNVRTMQNMFLYASFPVDPNISGWDTSKVTDMSYMFRGSDFNYSLVGFNTSTVKDMEAMFRSCTIFDQDLGSWDVSNVTTMRQMFSTASLFTGVNGNINNWRPGKLVDAYQMFYVSDFNQPVGDWDTSSLENANSMFSAADLFDQDISGWDITALTNATSMFSGVTLSTANYDALIIGWEGQAQLSNVTLHAGISVLTTGGAAETARNALVADGWTITDSTGTHT